MNLDFSLLECLEAVATEGSFDKAATTLAITQSAVSQRIRALESQVGTPLLFRTRPVRPTPAAQPLLRFARQTRLLAMEVWPEMKAAATQGQLRIAVNGDSLGTWVLPALKDWVHAHPELTLEFVVDDQTQTQARLRNGEVLGSIGSEGRATKGFLVVPLGQMPYVCVASPEFAQRHFPRGLTIAAAQRAPALVFNRRDALQADHLARCLDWAEPRFPHHFVPAYEAYLEAAILGYGYGMSPLAQCRAALKDGLLVNVTPQMPVAVPLYWHTWQLESELIGSLGRALVAGAALALDALP
ncbi:LysR family transcriptional regulator ArgP [Uliginosibacterium aquaticum]|uniref:LysR family transcriptional regulator ArgP n=1 Tax=Uliginosibacterium aquaticum TaxID=2731212 RepID=A0ABX2IRC0_9RHOO|nr:LysR family transcriptional regulator ArgP [Uliginosibacterium aquaticum]NSL56846.1 LysR family transcriptional regulator ArgP [Uliginosibacterium aquaticum]